MASAEHLDPAVIEHLRAIGAKGRASRFSDPESRERETTRRKTRLALRDERDEQILAELRAVNERLAALEQHVAA
jgi:hypothetical protein